MNARNKAKRYKLALAFLKNETMKRGVGEVFYHTISVVCDRFKNENCRRWIEFDVHHEKAGRVHVVLMKPGSAAEELICAQNEKIAYLEKLVKSLERNLPAPPQACT